jgi:hypothetical protein
MVTTTKTKTVRRAREKSPAQKSRPARKTPGGNNKAGVAPRLVIDSLTASSSRCSSSSARGCGWGGAAW